MDNKLLKNFLHDTSAFLDRLGAQLLQLEKDPDNSEILEQCFRSAHSIKSEASYMDYEGMTQSAHQLESILEEMRSGNTILSSESLEEMLGLVDGLKAQKGNLETTLAEGEAGSWDVFDLEVSGNDEDEVLPGGDALVELPDTSASEDLAGDDEDRFEAESKDSSELPEVYTGGAEETDSLVEGLEERPIQTGSDRKGSSVFDLNPFQKSVLIESRKRGELFYRLICEIAPDTPMKYAKAYLLVNNLELIVNVINIFPPMENEDADFSELNILFTSAVSEGEIFRAVNVDQVSRIQLAGLRYEDAEGGVAAVPLPDETLLVEESLSNKAGSQEVRIDRKSLDEMGTYMEALRFLFHKNPECREEGLSLIKKMDRILNDIRMIPAGELFGGFARLVRDMAKKAGKEINFEMDGADVPIDRRLAQLLIEPLSHLIRNSIDHGIEYAAEREGLAKNPKGEIELKIEQSGRDILVVLSDDGRGINRDAIFTRAGEMGIYGEDEKELIHYLVQPGFSTVKEATTLSGRGMGLDLIQRSVKQNAGGKLSLITREGEGTSFIIRLPREYNPVKIILFRAGSGVYAVSSREQAETLIVEPGDFVKDSSGGLFLEGIPVYSIHGRLFMTGQPPREKTALKITHLGHEAWLLIHEMLFEQYLSEEQFKMGREISPHHFEVYSGGRKADYTYLNPSLFIS